MGVQAWWGVKERIIEEIMVKEPRGQHVGWDMCLDAEVTKKDVTRCGQDEGHDKAAFTE